ncbi:MAG: epoxyqueuosine reductase QueH [Spirochaetaceae bacterium]|nr:epoxyqueuosine reductase QueH [Spirochaetaceae bacterium]
MSILYAFPLVNDRDMSYTKISMKLLLHTCCAPCSVHCVENLRAEGIKPVLFWYNPNIHPVTEYRSRKDALIRFAGDENLDLVMADEYGLRPFIQGIYPDFDRRCAFCYRLRLEKTVRYGAEQGFTAFSTTLLISPYQDHDLIRETAQALGVQYGITFVYRDWRPRFRQGQEKARKLGLYMQKYCGCIFSEEERYR